MRNVFNQSLSYGTEYGFEVNDNYNNFLNIQGFDFQSNYIPNSKFSSVYQPNRILPFLPTRNGIDTNTIISDDNYGLEYCPYTWAYFHYYEDGFYDRYCGVWTRSYGLGHLTVLSNSFNDVGYGFRSTYLQEEPWVRALHIGLDPNYPISPTTTPTSTPTPTSTFSLASTPTPTPTPSRTLQILEEKIVIDDFSVPQVVDITLESDVSSESVSSESFQIGSMLGGERDMLLTVSSGFAGRSFSSGVFIIPEGYFFGEWAITNPSGGVSSSLNQYDGLDDSTSVNINGLNLNLFLLGVTHIKLYVISSTFSNSAQINFYDTDGSVCSVDILIGITSRSYYYEEIKQLIPISSLIGSCDLSKVGAIEISVDASDATDIIIKKISLDGPLSSPSVTSTNFPFPSISPSFTRTAQPTNSPSPTPSTTTSSSSSKTPTRTSTPTNTQTSTVSLSPGSLFTPSQTRTPSGSITPSTTTSASVSDTPTTQITSSATITSFPSKSQTPLQEIPVETKTSTPSPTTSPSITIEKSPGNLIGSETGSNDNFDVCSRIESQSEIITSRTRQTILLTKDNEVVGYLNIPSESLDSPVFVQTCSDTTNDISQSNDNFFNNQDLGTVVVDITIQDTFGNLITQFDVPIEICLLEDQLFVCIRNLTIIITLLIFFFLRI